MTLADREVFPGWNRADVVYLAQCLEGQHGEGMCVGSTEAAARFIRSALAVTEPGVRQSVSVTLTPEEHAELMRRRGGS